MPKPTDDTIIQIVVHEKPNKIWAFCNGKTHSARWRTSENGDNLRDVVGNADLLHAALLAWDGREAFSTTFDALETYSQGYGAWDEEANEPPGWWLQVGKGIAPKD